MEQKKGTWRARYSNKKKNDILVITYEKGGKIHSRDFIGRKAPAVTYHETFSIEN